MFLQDVLKISWKLLENVLKVFWKRVEDVWGRMARTNILVLTKTSRRRLEDVFWRRMTNVWLTYDYDVWLCLEMSWRRLLKTKTKDVFIKTSFWWDYLLYLWHPELPLMLLGQWKIILLNAFLALDNLDFLITLILFFQRCFLFELLNYWNKVVMKPFSWLLD